MTGLPGLRNLLIALLVCSAALFAVGVAVERSQPAHSAATERPEVGAVAGETHAAGETPGETAAEVRPTGAPGEAGEAHADGGEATAATTEPSVGESHTERVFGIDPESTGLVVAAVLGSLILALAMFRAPGSRPLLGAVALAMLLFVVFDVREAFHQADESRTGLVIIAAIVAGLHLAAAGVASLLLRKPEHPRGPAEVGA